MVIWRGRKGRLSEKHGQPRAKPSRRRGRHARAAIGHRDGKNDPGFAWPRLRGAEAGGSGVGLGIKKDPVKREKGRDSAGGSVVESRAIACASFVRPPAVRSDLRFPWRADGPGRNSVVKERRGVVSR